MKPPTPDADKIWHDLQRLASKAPNEETSVPFGFATRIVSRVNFRATEASWLTPEQFALRGALVAGLIAVAVIAFDYQLLTDLWSGDTLLAGSFVELISSP